MGSLLTNKKNTFITALLLTLSFNVMATLDSNPVRSVASIKEKLAGDWCKKYDDFTSALKIVPNKYNDLDFTEYSIGNEAGEQNIIQRGYFSFGALSWGMYDDDNNDLELLKAETILNKSRLILKYKHTTIMYKRCKLTYESQAKGSAFQILDDFNSQY